MQAGNEITANRAKILELEKYIQDELEPIEIEIRHHFAHGTYTREAFIPKGADVTGHIHRHSCINIISKGRILVVTDEGEYEISAPHTFVSGPFVKKAGHTLEDTIWINVFPWDGVMDAEAIKQAAIVAPHEMPKLEVRDSQ